MTDIRNNIREKFHELVFEINKIHETHPNRPPDKEYIILLKFIKENQESYREEFIELIWNILGNRYTNLLELVEFLIHELKWEELREKILLLKSNNQEDNPLQYNIRGICFYLLEAFKEDWDGRDIYECYD